MKTVAETFRIGYQPGDVFRFKPIADVHFGSRHCDVRAFKQFLSCADDKTYFIGLGDLLDMIIVSDVKRYRKSGDASEGEDIINDAVNGMYEILRPYTARIIGLGQGNHEDTIVKRCSINPTKWLCDRLGVPYLGYSFLLRVIFSNNGGQGRTVVFRGHHGFGGGSRTQGADLTKYARDMAHFDADIFLYGHVHKLQYDTVPRLALSGSTLIQKPKHLCICGTYLKTYSDSTDVTYAEVKGYPPAKIGGLTIDIKPTSPWVDIRAEV